MNIKKTIKSDYSINDKDHVFNKKILSFMCPVCHNKTVYDTEKDVYRPYEVDYDDLCVCDECGSEMYARPQYDGTIKFEINTESCTNITASEDYDVDLLSTIRSEVQMKARQVMTSPSFGFPDDEVDNYLFVDAEVIDGAMRIEVRAELSYDGMIDLAEELNPIVDSYCKDAYFDMDQPGIMSAFLPLDEVEACVTASRTINSSTSDGYSNGTYWTAIYKDINGNKHKIVFEFDSSDYDEAEEELDAVIQEPYTYSKLLGRAPLKSAEKDGFEFISSCDSILSSDEVDVSDYEFIADRDGYFIYRKIVDDGNGKHHGEWAAQDHDKKYPPFKITYMQARGYDVIDKYDSDVKKLSRELGRMLLPNSSVRASEEFEEYEDEIKEIDQEFTSENTSINSTKLPAVFKMVSFEPGTVNIDYGGGRFDNVADYLSKYDVINLVYDPYNRTPEHNKEVIKMVRDHGGADTATCSNVLNVIKEPEVRLNVLNNIKKLVKSSGEIYITVYEGSGKGNEGATKSGYQLNRKTADYLEEIQQVFPDARRKGKLIIAHPSGSVSSSVNAARKPKYWDTMFRNNVLDDYQNGKLSFDNIDEWEKDYNGGVAPNPKLGTREILDYYVSHPESIGAASSFGEDSDTYFQVYSLTDDGELADHLEDFDDVDSAISYARGVCENGPCEVVEIEATDRGLQQSVCHISADGSVTYLDEQSVLSASYGGAYDIEDDMFFTREDINEFGYDVADEMSSWSGETFDLSETYMVDPVNLHIEVTNNDIWLDADVKIDMRKIRRPSDLNKYEVEVLRQLKESYNEYHQNDDFDGSESYPDGVDAAQKIEGKEKESSVDFMMDGSDVVEAGWGVYDYPEPPDEPEPVEDDDVEELIELTLDAVVTVEEGGGWEYEDTDYPWADVDFGMFDEPYLDVDDKIGAVEHVDELLEEKMPYEPGKYHIFGDVELYYDVSNILYYPNYYPNPDGDPFPAEDREYIRDSVDIDWNRGKSKIYNFKFEKLD